MCIFPLRYLEFIDSLGEHLQLIFTSCWTAWFFYAVREPCISKNIRYTEIRDADVLCELDFDQLYCASWMRAGTEQVMSDLGMILNDRKKLEAWTWLDSGDGYLFHQAKKAQPGSDR